MPIGWSQIPRDYCRQTPIFRHPFFIKQCFSLEYSLVSHPSKFLEVYLNSEYMWKWSLQGFFYEFKVPLSANVCYCIKADQTSTFTSLWDGSISVDYSFQIMQWSKENSHHFLSSIKITLILTIKIINLRISRATPHYCRKSWWKRVPHWVKTHKRIWSEKRRYIVKNLILFLCIFYSTYVCASRKRGIYFHCNL